MRTDIKGDIVSNDDEWIYEWMGWECTTPRIVKEAIATLADGEALEVYINSGGGDVFAGQEIYSLLRECKTSKAIIEGIAGSAAGVAAMGAHHVSAYPVGMIMIHNVSVGGACGDYHDMDRYSNMLKQMNKAMSNAYVEKSGKPLDEVLKMMDKETWLTANQALENGFIDEVISETPAFANDIFGMRLTEDIRQKVIKEKEERDNEEQKLMESLRPYLG